MTEDVRLLLRWVCGGDINHAQAQAKIILARSTTQKDVRFCENMLRELDRSKARFMELPPNLQGTFIMEDTSIFPEERYLLRPSEEAVIKELSDTYAAAKVLAAKNIHYSPSAIFHGPSGTGKTMLAKYLAYHLGINYAYIRFSNLLDSLLGGTSKKIAAVFDYVKKNPCVLCLDEMDLIASSRAGNGDCNEINRVTISLMQEIDQLPNDVIIIGTTNIYDALDQAIIRRFQIKHEVKPLSEDDQLALAKKFFTFMGYTHSDEHLREFITDAKAHAKEKTGKDYLTADYIVNECTRAMVQDISDRIRNGETFDTEEEGANDNELYAS